MKKRNEEVKEEKRIVYPRFLSTAPQGVDLFEGKSQEKIKEAIEQYILDTDNPQIDLSEDKLPHLIGLEGRWGSGKSNVIKMLEKNSALKEDYIFFTYDAWGNQEDLQRKSILFMLTQQLIANKQLVGKTLMLNRNPQENKDPELMECTWAERLQALTTHKSYTREITEPSIYNSTKWFGLAIVAMGLLVGILQIDGALAWWLNVLISLAPLFLFVLYITIENKGRFVEGWRKMFAMYESGAKTDTTSYVISEDEPTVPEFKNWMHDLSRALERGKKLVIVFDNMDRLSKEKVRTLWSSIHTFFADSNNGYENVWCIIPYDSQHLVNAFDADSEEKKADLLNRFLQKTFPVIYHVPEPIITDYKEVVGKLLHKAFGNTFTDEEYDIINRCYRLAYPKPNVREIIGFINDMVQIYHSWNTEIGALPMAIYVLQKKHIDNPANSAEEYILDKSYENAYRHVLSSEQSEDLQRNIAALHYGVNPDKAYQIMLKRRLSDIFNTDTRISSLAPYMSNEEQLSILEEVVFELEPTRFEKAAKLFVSVEKEDISQMALDKLQKFWNHFADGFIRTRDAMPTFTEFMHQVIEHIPESKKKKCAKHYVSRLYQVGKDDGANVYKQLSTLFSKEYAATWEVDSICPRHALSPGEYLKYVSTAQKAFDKYPIITDVTKLNEHLISLLQQQFTFVEEVRLLKSNYDLQPFVDKVAEMVASEKQNAIMVAPLLQVLRIYYDKFPLSTLSVNYIEQLWASVQADQKLACYSEIYALKALMHITVNMPIDDAKLQILVNRMLFYTDTASLITKCISLRHPYLVQLTQYFIKENKHDSSPSIKDWIKDWQLLANICHVDRTNIVAFAADWGYQLTEAEQKASINTLLAEPEWIGALLTEPITPLADSLLKKFAGDVQSRAVSEFLQNGTIAPTNSYWYNVLKHLINTNYIPNTEAGTMKELVLSIIRFVAKGNKIDNDVLMSVVRKCRFIAISTEMYELRRNILNKSEGYVVTPNNFGFLHAYLEKTEINSESHRNDAANVILVNVIDNQECQQIIMSNGDYYKPIITETEETASALHAKIKAIVSANPDTAFSKYLQELVEVHSGEGEES